MRNCFPLNLGISLPLSCSILHKVDYRHVTVSTSRDFGHDLELYEQHCDDQRHEVQSKPAPAVARECSLCVGSIDPAPVARECSLCVGSIDPAPVSHESNLLWIQSKLPLSAPCLDWSRCWRSRPKAHASQSSCVIMQYRSCSGLT